MFTRRAGAGSTEAWRARANGVQIEARRAGAEALIEGQSRDCGGSIGDSLCHCRSQYHAFFFDQKRMHLGVLKTGRSGALVIQVRLQTGLKQADPFWSGPARFATLIHNLARFTAGWLEVAAGLIWRYITASSPNSQWLPCSRADTAKRQPTLRVHEYEYMLCSRADTGHRHKTGGKHFQQIRQPTSRVYEYECMYIRLY